MTQREWLHCFSKRLAELIYENRISQNDLCKMSGLGKSTISRYLHETQMPNLRAVMNLCYALHVDYEELIDFGERIEMDDEERNAPDWIEDVYND